MPKMTIRRKRFAADPFYSEVATKASRRATVRLHISISIKSRSSTRTTSQDNDTSDIDTTTTTPDHHTARSPSPSPSRSSSPLRARPPPPSSSASNHRFRAPLKRARDLVHSHSRLVLLLAVGLLGCIALAYYRYNLHYLHSPSSELDEKSATANDSGYHSEKEAAELRKQADALYLFCTRRPQALDAIMRYDIACENFAGIQATYACKSTLSRIY